MYRGQIEADSKSVSRISLSAIIFFKIQLITIDKSDIQFKDFDMEHMTASLSVLMYFIHKMMRYLKELYIKMYKHQNYLHV